jgi:hypothetical protein
MSTALLALALLSGLGIIAFLISLGLTSLDVLLSWIFPLTTFQGRSCTWCYFRWPLHLSA